jgi:hypothetical protein
MGHISGNDTTILEARAHQRNPNLSFAYVTQWSKFPFFNRNLHALTRFPKTVVVQLALSRQSALNLVIVNVEL